MLDERLSQNGKNVKGSKIRELLKYKTNDSYFFAGGLPAESMLPCREFQTIAGEMFERQGVAALQYGPSRGYPPLRKYLIERMTTKGLCKTDDDVIITSGSQQAIELILKLFIDKEDGVLAEDPTFVSSLNSIRNYSNHIYAAKIEDDGVDLDDLEAQLKAHDKIKLLYLIPTFQNPTGAVMSLEKRKRLLILAEQFNVLVLEDDPYGEIRYEGEDIPTLKALDTGNRVIYVGSFSKILSPGVRVGWVLAERSVVDKLELFKQSDDVHTSMVSQLFTHSYICKYDLDAHIAQCRELYHQKSAIMMDAIKEHFPGEFKVIRPKGGLFVWCTLPGNLDADELLERCLSKKTVFVPGAVFQHNGGKACSSFRLNYSNATPEQIKEGMWRIGESAAEYMKESNV